MPQHATITLGCSFLKYNFVSVLGCIVAKLVHIIDAVRRNVTVVLPWDFSVACNISI